MTALNFPLSYWHPAVHAQVLLAEFLQTDWETITKTAVPFPRPEWTELGAVRAAIDRQDARTIEIIRAQADIRNIGPVFLRAVLASDRSHPKTAELVHFAANDAAHVAAMYWKEQYNRARPSQHDPSLRTAIDAPGHPAYPGLHATAAHLAARTLAAVLGNRQNEIESIAHDIARNREVAGLHYPSDSQHRKMLAETIFDHVLQGTTTSGQPLCPVFLRTLAFARAEW